jgi:hypothetical protein
MTLRPGCHFVQRGPKRGAKRCEAVVHVPVRVTDHAPGHQAIAFELTQVLGEHFVSDVGHCSLEIVEAARAAASERPEDQRFPFAADDVDRQLHWASVCVRSSRGHCSFPSGAKRTERCVDPRYDAIVNGYEDADWPSQTKVSDQ